MGKLSKPFAVHTARLTVSHRRVPERSHSDTFVVTTGRSRRTRCAGGARWHVWGVGSRKERHPPFAPCLPTYSSSRFSFGVPGTPSRACLTGKDTSGTFGGCSESLLGTGLVGVVAGLGEVVSPYTEGLLFLPASVPCLLYPLHPPLLPSPLSSPLVTQRGRGRTSS